jgi:hypothetical protein
MPSNVPVSGAINPVKIAARGSRTVAFVGLSQKNVESIVGISVFDDAVELCKVSGIAPHAMDENKEVCDHKVWVKGREMQKTAHGC